MRSPRVLNAFPYRPAVAKSGKPGDDWCGGVDGRAVARTTATARLGRRARPLMYFCQLYGMGCCREEFPTVHRALTLISLSASVYVYYNVITYVGDTMPDMFDLSTVMSAVRLNARGLAHSLMIAFFDAHRGHVLDFVAALDDLVPSAARLPLRPFAARFFGWLTATLAAELLQVLAYYCRAGFGGFTVVFTSQFILSNVWIVTPVLVHMTLVSLACRGVRDINGRITSFGSWRADRHRWARLQRSVARLTDTAFGAIIVAFVIFVITDLTFFAFVATFSWINGSLVEFASYVLLMFVRAALTFQLFRTCHRCKAEMKKTQTILSGTKMTTLSDMKEFQNTSLYMLHTDFSFMPCRVFEITYKNLATITAIVVAYSTFQIQFKHG